MFMSALTFLIEGGHAQWKMVFINTEYCEISAAALFGVHPYGELQSRILGVDEHHDFCQDFGFKADSRDGKVVDISTQRSI